MQTKQIIFAVLICILSAAAVIAAILGQGESQTIDNRQIQITEIEDQGEVQQLDTNTITTSTTSAESMVETEFPNQIEDTQVSTTTDDYATSTN